MAITLAHLTISIVAQGLIAAAFLTSLCAFIGWLADLSNHKCVHADNPAETFDVGAFVCLDCIKTFFRIHITGLKKRNILAIILASAAATCYIFLTILSFEKEDTDLSYLAIGWFLSLFSVPIAYGFRAKPDAFVTDVVLCISVIFLCMALVAVQFELYHQVLVMGGIGSCIFAINVYMQLITHSIKNTTKVEIYNDRE